MKTERGWHGIGWVLLVLVLAGCRQPDPLELRVEAETPYAFIEWEEHHLARMPPGIALEFRDSVARIVATSPTKMSLRDTRMLHSKYHPICRQLHGKTVREVVITGYSAANEALLRGMILDSDNLLVTLKHQDQLEQSAGGAKRVERLVDRRTAMLGAAKAQVEANRQRIEELRQVQPVNQYWSVRFWGWRVLLHILL